MCSRCASTSTCRPTTSASTSSPGDGAHFVRDRATRPDVLMVDGFDSNGLPARLSSQRFYDDCHEMLQPGGIMVANLHYGHRQYALHLDRMQRSFDGAVLVVDDGELSNSIVFACKGCDLESARAGVIHRPKGLDRAGREQLLGAFAAGAAAPARPRRGLIQPFRQHTPLGYHVPHIHIPLAWRGSMELKTARLTLLIDPNKKAAFERLCAQRDLTASQVVRQMIRDYLAQHGVSYEPSGVGEDEPEARPSPAPSSAAPRKVVAQAQAAAKAPAKSSGARRRT